MIELTGAQLMWVSIWMYFGVTTIGAYVFDLRDQRYFVAYATVLMYGFMAMTFILF